jgi:serine/threonine protein kinase
MYAMKVLDKNMLTDQRKLKQIENERKVMQALNHPFIVKLYWAFQTNTTLNFIMDLCVGGELFYRLKSEKRLTESKTRFYLAELVLAFEYMHSKNIVYRDLKPENVIIDIDGHIKLADFGLSKELKKSHTQSFWGSPEYMSPEMLRGETHDLRLDLYCIGTLMYEMMTGLPPHYSKDVNTMYQQIVDDPVLYPPFLSRSAASLMNKLLWKFPIDRFQTIEEVKNHEFFKDVNWDDYYNKRVEPEWKPDLVNSCFDPEYTSMPIDMTDFETEHKVDSRRGGEFWMEGVYQLPNESNFSSRTVTEQSISQSFISDINIMANFNIPNNIEGSPKDINTSISMNESS